MAVASKRLAWTKAAVFVAFCGLAVSARADLPPAMDKTPGGALGVVAIRNLTSFQGRVSKYAEMFGMEVEGSPLEMMDQLLSTPGFTKDGSAMVVLLPGSGESKDPLPVVLAPVADVKAFAASVNAQGENVMTATFGEDQVYMKDVGSGYMAMSPDEAAVTGFKIGQAASAGLKQSMGAAAFRAADRADIVVYLTPALANSGLDSGGARLKEQMEAISAMAGPNGAPSEVMGKAADAAKESFERDGQAMVITLGLDDSGAVLDVVSQFKEGSPSAQTFQIPGNAGSVSASLPDGNMLFAGSVDTSSPLLKSWVREIRERQANQEGAAGPIDQLMASMDKIDGIGMSIGVPAGGLMGGMLTASSTFIKTSDSAGLVAAMKAGMEKLDGQAVGDSKIKATYKSAAVDAGGSKVDSWSLNVPIDQNNPNAMQAQQMEMMLFAGSPGGLVGSTDKGVVMTMGNNSKLMGAAIEAAKGGKGLATQELVSAVRSRLQEDRAFEVYIGVKGIIDMVGPLISMQTGGAPMKSPEKLSPVALAGSMNGGAVGFRLVVPNDVLQTVSDIMADMQEMNEDGGDGDGDNAAPEGENRPPRF